MVYHIIVGELAAIAGICGLVAGNASDRVKWMCHLGRHIFSVSFPGKR